MSRRDKLNEFQFLICNVLYFNLHFFELLESDVFLRNGDGHVVSQIPDILCIYIELLAPVCVDGEMIVVALVEDETDVARKGSLTLVVEEFYFVEIDVYWNYILTVFIRMNLILLLFRNLYLIFAA